MTYNFNIIAHFILAGCHSIGRHRSGIQWRCWPKVLPLALRCYAPRQSSVFTWERLCCPAHLSKISEMISPNWITSASEHRIKTTIKNWQSDFATSLNFMRMQSSWVKPIAIFLVKNFKFINSHSPTDSSMSLAKSSNSSLQCCCCGRCFVSLVHCCYFDRNWLSWISVNMIFFSIKFKWLIVWCRVCRPNVFVFHRIKSADDSSPIELIFAVITMGASSISTLFCCEFGEIVGKQFKLFDEELCQCNWYAFPIDMQQLLVTFMTNTQRTAVFRGFANTECTRETFKNVCILSIVGTGKHETHAMYWINSIFNC